MANILFVFWGNIFVIGFKDMYYCKSNNSYT